MQASKKTQVKGGKAAAKVETPVVEAPVVVPIPAAAAAEPVAPVEVKKGGRKAKVSKVEAPVTQVEQAGGEAVDADEQDQGDGRLRYFKLLYDGEVKGRFCGRKPKQAANKAFSSIIKEKLSGGGNGVVSNVEFSIRECTRGSKQKDYYYTGSREELKNHVEVQIQSGGSTKTITYKFQNKLQKSKAPAAKQAGGEVKAAAAAADAVQTGDEAPVATGGKAKRVTKAKVAKAAPAAQAATAATAPVKKEKASTKGKKVKA